MRDVRERSSLKEDVVTRVERGPNVFRPCPHMDVNCIGKYFLSSGQCSQPAGRVPDPLKLSFQSIYLPGFNASLLQEDLTLKGINGDIVEFYINQETDRAVLAFRVKDFDTETKKCHFTYLSPGREPITATTTLVEEKDSAFVATASFTVVFEGTRPLNLRHSFAHASVEVLPTITIGIEPLTVKDLGYQAMFSGIFSDLAKAYREAFLSAAPNYSNIFIQNTLCDFVKESFSNSLIPPSAYFPSNRYLIPSQEAGSAVVTVLGLLMSLGSDPDVFRPCPHMDVNCIRNHFLSSGLCSPPVGRVPDSLRRSFQSVYLPRFNATLLLEDLTLKGVTGDIVEFYINRKTDRAVLAFRVKDFDVETMKGHYTFLLPAREPITATTTIMENKGTVLFTVLFEGTQPLDLRHSFAHATVEVVPKLTIGTEPLAVKDPGYKTMFNEVFSDLAKAYREGYLSVAPNYSNVFIQYTLCDFGIRD
ncbi:Fibrohexamerin [Eumeta japonica]|uniref:Fibrohexamerin n=1 Tax=Eumeta variegata TaxID=151549 RepID=A0A4C1VX03_EUMVA|nr:Fibrohexamerin [Eumeta japonica]